MIFYSTCIFFLYLLFIFGCPGSRCCIWAFSSCGKEGLLFTVVSGLLIAVASLVAGMQTSVIDVHGLSCSVACGIVLNQGSNSCPLHWKVDS